MHKRFAVTLGFLTLSLSPFSGNAYEKENKPENAWSVFKTPYLAKTNSIGSYSNGCLAGANELAETGDGYYSVRRHRNRFYGHPELIGFIESLGAYIDNKYQRKLLIGDMSQARGGRMNFGHSSHQIGLDVDIWLQSIDVKERPAENRDMVSIVNRIENRLTNPMSAEMRDALYYSASNPKVARIFVNPVIKYSLCQSEADTAWLRKLRPWWGHDEHFHVRLNCPTDSPDCQNQAAIPAGSGCDDNLYAWVDEQNGLATGRIKPKKTTAKPKVKKNPPSACSIVFQN